MTGSSAARAYIDANVFVVAMEGEDDIAGPAIAILDILRRNRGMGVTSEITLLEVLPKARMKGGSLLFRRYLDLIVTNGFFSLSPVTRDLMFSAVDYRQQFQLGSGDDPKSKRAIDALHVASALSERCAFLLTHDRRIRVPDSLKVLPPDREALNLLQSLQ